MQNMAEKCYQRIEKNVHMESSLFKVEIEVEELMIKLTANIIAVTQFWSSYRKGKTVL